MAKDPVCGMQVDEKTATARSEYEGTIYFFCSEGCRQHFEEDPRKFIAQSADDWHRP